MDLTSWLDVATPVLSHDITKWTIAFGVAAFIHSGRVKAEIKKQFTGIVNSIDNLGTALRNDMNAQSSRIMNVEKNVTNIADRVGQLEKGEKK